jgi:hypothetical protein
MFSLIVPGVLSAAWLVMLIRQRRSGRGTSAIAAALCPIALLFLTVPVAMSAVELMRGFRVIARERAGGVADLAPYCIEMARAMWSGGVGLLVVMAAAAAAQLIPRIDRSPGSSGPEPLDEPPAPSPIWTAIFIGSSLLVFAVLAYVVFVAGIPRLVLGTAAGITTVTNLGGVVSRIASQLVAAVLLGACLSVVLLAAGVVNLFGARRVGSHGLLVVFSWLLAAAAALLGAWALVSASASIQAFQRFVR